MTSSHILMGGWVSGDDFAVWTTGRSKIGFYNLDINNTATGFGAALRIDTGNSEVFVVNCEVQSNCTGDALDCGGLGGGGNPRQGNSQVVIKGCTLVDNQASVPSGGGFGEPLNLDRNYDTVVQNNTILWHLGQNEVQGTIRTLFQNNTLNRDTQIGNYTEYKRGICLSGSEDIAIRYNTLNKVVTTGPTEFVQNNDNEEIMDENNTIDDSTGSPADAGYVTSATSTTLTDSTRNWPTTGSTTWSEPIYGENITYSVAIVGGPGAGQIRNVIANTATTITVDQPWTVQPNAESTYSIRFISQHELEEGNTITHMSKGIWFYGDSTQDVTVVNNTLTDSMGIWILLDYRNHGVQRYDVMCDGLFANNSAADTLGLYWTAIGMTHGLDNETSELGTAAYTVDFRSNTLTAYTSPVLNGLLTESYLCTPSTSYSGGYSVPGNPYQGIIFQNNTAANCPNQGYWIGTGDYALVLYNTTYNNVATHVYNQVGTGMSYGAVGTYPTSP